MPMIGDLQSFALPDLLRTLGKAHQSGQLSVWSKEGVYRIWLNKGAVSTAIAPYQECALKAICLDVMDLGHGALFQPLRSSSLVLSEPLGNWVIQQNWLTEDARSLVFQKQLHAGLYPLFELASGQFYFVGDMVPLPYWEMTGLELAALEAISQGLEFINGKTDQSNDWPPLDCNFLSQASTTTAFRLSLLDRRLLQWFRKPNTIQSLSQVLNVEPMELQKACKRLLHLQMIKAVAPGSTCIAQTLPKDERYIAPTEANYSLAQKIAAVLNTPVGGKSK